MEDDEVVDAVCVYCDWEAKHQVSACSDRSCPHPGCNSLSDGVAVDMKTCTKCRERKPVDQFYGYVAQCRRCINTRDQAYSERKKAEGVTKPCSIEGCGAQVTHNGMCMKHNTRVRRHGDPNIVFESVKGGKPGKKAPKKSV